VNKINGPTVEAALVKSHCVMRNYQLVTQLVQHRWITNNLWLLPVAALYYLAIR
jgi:hypothetical protein